MNDPLQNVTTVDQSNSLARPVSRSCSAPGGRVCCVCSRAALTLLTPGKYEVSCLLCVVVTLTVKAMSNNKQDEVSEISKTKITPPRPRPRLGKLWCLREVVVLLRPKLFEGGLGC